MFELIFLGTSASSPSVHRGLSAHMILHRQYRFLLDCGEGTQRQILTSGLGFKRLDKVLLTHGHLDHILGLGGLVSTLSRWETLDKLQIYGGKATLQRVHDLIYRVVLRDATPPVEIELVPLKDDLRIMEDDKFTLSAFPVVHRGPGCFGFLFTEKARRPFLAEKAEALGVPFGPERAKLVRGEAVTLTDGRTIDPEEVLGETIAGVKYVHIGDVGRTDNLVEICRDADALVIEATYIEEEAEMARTFGHLTAGQAARLARAANVKSLILTHLSRRYSERMVRDEARAIFPQTEVARDLDHFQISRDGAVLLGTAGEVGNSDR
ncbi:MAG: ribonuclease Z [Chloroflexi bacterium]|nr:ribonuclease Z [Chloroflexota bacterium]MBP8057935.1 ribonuclease Z [Chloroflexota bacterium]